MIYFILAVLIVLLDQAVKYLLSTSMALGSTAELIPGFVRLIYVRNTGAAFSFLSDMRWVLVAVSFVVIVGVVYAMIRYRSKLGVIGRLGLAVLLGGAFSNFIDRALFGYVADFFEFEFVRFAVFNVADIFITVGGIVFCLYYLFHRDEIGGDDVLFGRKKEPLKASDGKDRDDIHTENQTGDDRGPDPS